jgi:crotonobetainyl-CoA:carnitine CoA-transferase CaiB-like acyl-CoA transferase
LRVLDLSSVVVGPYCTLALADMGADVVKIEPPAGDNLRHIGPRRNANMGSQFLGLNRNKRSLVLNLKQPDARQALLRLVETADVFVHNMRAQAIGRLNLTYDDVRQSNPRIVYCSIHGFLQAGPYRDKAAYDDIIQGASGLAALQARAGEAPRYVVSAVADKTPAMVAVSSILMALLNREWTGEGQEIEVPMFETMVSYVMTEHLYGHTFEPPLGPTVYSRQVSPYRRPHQTADGYLCALMYTDAQWARFFDVAGRPGLLQDPRFVDFGSRTDHIDELYALVAETMRARTTADWLAIFEQSDIPAMPLNTPDDLLRDEHLAAIDFFPIVDHPSEGALRYVGVPVVMSRTPAPFPTPAPRLGEHSQEVLGEAGYSQSEIDALVESGATRVPDGVCSTR